MTRDRYLRDSRHLNKFLFTRGDPLFYEPFEAQYEPNAELQDLVRGLVETSAPDWELTRDGFWTHVHPGTARQRTSSSAPALPPQGWKVHVSATLANSPSILRRAARIGLAEEVPFKFAVDRNVLSLMSSKAWGRSRSGKFITLYPYDLARFERLIERLYRELRDEEGPYVLSDKRYKDCRVLYYRYGGMRPTTRLEITGEKTPVLIAPDGTLVPDVRNPYFAPPAWAEDPFPDDGTPPGDLSLDGGRYLVEKALTFSNSGGVYLAEDRETGGKVVLKEARAHTLMDGHGSDAIHLLEREHGILETLRDSGVAAAPIGSFRAWENSFLAEELVDGLDVREIMLTRSPLLRVSPDHEESRRYYETYRQIVCSLIRGLRTLHDRGVVFGDLSASNLKVDPATWDVRFIDFEAAFRVGVDRPTLLYTPGFKTETSIREDAHGFAEDLYSVAAVMLYLIFPISALASLRDDLFDAVLENLLDDVGWSQTNVLEVARGLARNEIDLARAGELLDQPAQILPPRRDTELETEPWQEISRRLGSFLLASMRGGSQEALFPADPFVHRTNPLGLGFGACGVLYTLEKCGFEIPKAARDWLERRLDDLQPRDLPPGLLTGSAGIAWCLAEIGLEDRAAELMSMANESELLDRHHSYLYGMAGVGMANAAFYAKTGSEGHLRAARELGERLLERAQESAMGISWESSGVVQIGFGYGQSGVALFFLRLYELTADERFLTAGRRALELDLSHGVENEEGVLAFPCAPAEKTLLPYLEEGSAGIAKVALRYGLSDRRVEMMLRNAHRKYASFAGLFYGLSSFVDVLTDAFLVSADRRFLEMARRPLAGIRDLYFVEQPNGLATPGDGLLRISCDYATGVAGVLRTVHRFCHLEHADFVLDDLGVAPGAADDGPRDHPGLSLPTPAGEAPGARPREDALSA